MERYRSIVPEYEAFLEALERPLPLTVRTNRIAASPEQVRGALRDLGATASPLDWFPEAFRVDLSTVEGDVSIGRTLPHYLGWIHAQEEVSMIPPVVLSPDPGDVVLDLCAAPGSKTTQLAQDAAAVVANDDDIGRIAALRSNADRLGCTNVAVTNVDGRRFPGRDRFDAALVDVPCTAEGTARKNPDLRGRSDAHESASLAGVQRQLLARAVELVRPGGTVVYATCTFAPEENEAVVSSVVEDGDATIEAFDVGPDHEPGVARWDGERFVDGIERTHRYYPHLNDTGGFYVAKLRVA